MMNEPLNTISATSDNRIALSFEDERAVLRARIEELERESAERKWMDDALKALAFGTATATGQGFLQQLIRQLSAILQVPYVFVTEFVPGKTDRVRTVAGWCRGEAVDSLEYALHDSPCEKVFQDGLVFLPRHVQQTFPKDEDRIARNIESYMGAPLLNSAGRPTGHLCVMDVRPFSFAQSQGRAIITIFAERAAAELERLRTEETLRQSEERFRALYEHNPTMYFTLTADGTVLSVNRFGADELGYHTHELVGQSVLAVFQTADHPTVLAQLIVCSQNPGRTFDWEIQKVRKGGQLLWVKEQARAITGPDGSPIILVVCEDITEQRRTQELIRDRDQELQTTMQFLHTLVQESPLPIVSLDANARVTSWNQAATKLFGWTENEVLGRELPYVPAGQEADADALWSEGIRNGIRGPLSIRRIRKDGTPLDLLLWPVFVEDSTGHLTTAVGLYVDQSDLQRAEAARLHSEERLRSFLNALDDLAFELDEHGTYINVWTRNDSLLLRPKQEIIGQSLIDIHGYEAGRHYLAVLRRVLASGTTESIDYQITLEGVPRHFSAILTRIPANANIPATVACVVRETTAQKRSSEALHLSEQHLKSIIETSPECIKLVAADGTLLQINAAGLAMIEADRAVDVIGQCIYPLVAAPHREAFRAMNEHVCLGQKESLEFEITGLRGTRRWMETHAVPLRNPSDGTVAQLAITRDITDRKHAVSDRERISQDLHDNILQSLYAVGMQLEAGKLLAGKAPRKSKQHVTQAIRQLNSLVVEVRQFITDLTHRTAPTLDFSVALNQLVASCSSETRSEPELTLDPAALTVITPAIGEQLLSIAREALSNSVRHAGAAHRSVSLTKANGSVRLRVADDGKGFAPGRKRRRGHGLANMAARAKTIGAQFTLASAPDHGTSITIDVPTGDPHAC